MPDEVTTGARPDSGETTMVPGQLELPDVRFEQDLDAIIAMVAEPEPPKAFVAPRPARGAERVDLVRPGPGVLVSRPISEPAKDRYVDSGLALLLRNRVPLAAAPERTSAPRLREPALGLPLAILLGLVATFVAFVSAEPFWLANGVGSTGTATVVRCESRLLTDQCVGRFTPRNGSFTATARLAGLEPGRRTPGARIKARMLHQDSDVVYAEPKAGLHLRWILGFALVVGCGAAVGAATGVRRLRREGPRRVASLWGLCFAGPLLLFSITLLMTLT